jgi:type IV pilus assembly protein PilM
VRFLRPKPILGLDIGSHSIKLVEIKHTNEGPVIAYAQRVPIPQTENDPLIVEDAIRETLQTLVRSDKMRGKRVVTAVPASVEEQVTMRSIFIPDLPIDAPSEIIRTSVEAEFEVQEFCPFPHEEAQIDFHIERETTRDGERGLEVFVAAVHRDLIERYKGLIRDCGLIPVAIDVDFLALARLIVVATELTETEDVAILDIGNSKTAVGFYQHGKLRPYPHVPFGGYHLTSHVAQYLNLDWAEAEGYKHGEGGVDTGNPEEAAVWDALEASLDHELYQQLHGHFDGYLREFPEFRPSKIIISGGTAQIPQLDEFFASRLAIPVDVFHYLNRISVDVAGDIALLGNNEPLFATAVGLALKRNV